MHPPSPNRPRPGATHGRATPAFVVRPLGAVAFGALADVSGRKVALIATLALMGAATCLVGCLPTYEHIGPAAPALLTLLREIGRAHV